MVDYTNTKELFLVTLILAIIGVSIICFLIALDICFYKWWTIERKQEVKDIPRDVSRGFGTRLDLEMCIIIETIKRSALVLVLNCVGISWFYWAYICVYKGG